MSELIGGKEALIALANGKEVQYKFPDGIWMNFTTNLNLRGSDLKVVVFLNDYACFRLKPRTIYLNGIEVPAPFEPEEGDTCFILDTEQDEGFYRFTFSENSGIHKNYVYLGAWRTEEEIKQVVAALRSVFKPK